MESNQGAWRVAGRRVGRAGWNKDADVYKITAETIMGGCVGNFLTVDRFLSLSVSLSLSPWVLHIRSSDHRSLREWVLVGRVDGDSELLV